MVLLAGGAGGTAGGWTKNCATRLERQKACHSYTGGFMSSPGRSFFHHLPTYCMAIRNGSALGCHCHHYSSTISGPGWKGDLFLLRACFPRYLSISQAPWQERGRRSNLFANGSSVSFLVDGGWLWLVREAGKVGRSQRRRA